MSSFIAIHYTTQGPVFATVPTAVDAWACLSQWVNQRPLRLGDAVAIVTADTDQVVYYRHLSRSQMLWNTLCQPWMQFKRLVFSYLMAAKAA